MVPSLSLPVGPPSRQHTVPSLNPVVTVNPATTTMKKDLFIIFQAGQEAVIFQTVAMDDHNKSLQKFHVPNGGDLHFFESGSKIYAVSGHGMLEISLSKSWETIKRSVVQTIADPFIMVTRVGGETIGLTDTMRVYYQTKYTHPTASWLPYKINGADVCREVLMSGYVVVNDDTFIFCDALTSLCFLFDMGAKQWRVAMNWAAFREDVPKTNGLLNGRCVFVDDFIYTCRNGGLAAHELIAEHGSEYIRKPIFLPFSWDANCVGKDMCLDYAGKDKDSGSIFFYVVQGEYLSLSGLCIDYACMVVFSCHL